MATNTEIPAWSRNGRLKNPSWLMLLPYPEWLDFAIYLFSAAGLAIAFFPESGGADGVIQTLSVLALGFLARPIGAIVLGRWGDMKGRRRVLLFSGFLACAATVLIGLIPTYDTIGIAAPILLLVLRLVQGFALGGEFPGTFTYLVEAAPVGRRTSYGSMAPAGAVAAILTAAVLVLIVRGAMSAEAYAAWGWRIPFLVGGVSLFFVVATRFSLAESPKWLEVKKAGDLSDSPFRDIFRNHWRGYVSRFLFVLVVAMCFHFTFGAFFGYLDKVIKLPQTDVMTVQTVDLAILVFLILLFGRVADRISARRTLYIGLVGIIITAYPAFLLVSQDSLASAMLGQLLLAPFVAMLMAPYPAVLSSVFPVRVRLSGESSGNLSYAVVGGSLPLIFALALTSEGSVIGPASVLVITAIAGLFIFLPIRGPDDPPKHDETLDMDRQKT